MAYRKHATSKASRKAHHKRMKKRLKGTGLFPYDDGRGVGKSALRRRSKTVHQGQA